jgi:tetratricopeptide (TPR) repeat protein
LEFVYERTEVEGPVYVFKHALTQEVAYDSLLTSCRQALHAAAGQALEALYADRLEEAYDRLVYRYARTNEAAKAATYLTRVAERAAWGYAYAEAVTVLQEALVHAECLPADERDHCVVDLVTRQADALHFLGRRREMLDLLMQHQERLEQLRAPALTGRYYAHLAHAYIFLGEQQAAVQSARRAMEEAQQCHDDITMGWAHYLLGLEYSFAGPLLQAIDHARHAVVLLERTAEPFRLGNTYYTLAYSYYFMGDFVQALEALDRVEGIDEISGDRRLQTNAAALSGWSRHGRE